MFVGIWRVLVVKNCANCNLHRENIIDCSKWFSRKPHWLQAVADCKTRTSNHHCMTLPTTSLETQSPIVDDTLANCLYRSVARTFNELDLPSSLMNNYQYP
ncbi:hypothetical protein VNO77_17504 [Canavalia gladiata]|uniref:Uncharacterized protein n=1 Tax=Canavalia gladiata TaxID=3824 RepID=A0AAN9QGP3_CANGL